MGEKSGLSDEISVARSIELLVCMSAPEYRPPWGRRFVGVMKFRWPGVLNLLFVFLLLASMGGRVVGVMKFRWYGVM